MTPENPPSRPRPPLPEPFRNETRSGAGNALEIRLAESPPRALEARLEHALGILDARCVPPVSVLRPAHHRQTSRGHRESRL